MCSPLLGHRSAQRHQSFSNPETGAGRNNRDDDDDLDAEPIQLPRCTEWKMQARFRGVFLVEIRFRKHQLLS